MKIETTDRGFVIARFDDGSGEACSLQKSSAAERDMIWLGVDDPNPQLFPGDGTGWHPYPLPKNVQCSTRMHLTRERVAELLPLLQGFVETGELVESPPKSDSLDAETFRAMVKEGERQMGGGWMPNCIVGIAYTAQEPEKSILMAAWQRLSEGTKPGGVCSACQGTGNFYYGSGHTGGPAPCPKCTSADSMAIRNTETMDPLLHLLGALDDQMRGRRDGQCIEDMEARGQRELVNDTALPARCSPECRAKLESLGVKFGKPRADDPLFCDATLPVGWKKVATEHSMWSDLVDDKGAPIAAIFYKAAFYDRDAFMNLVQPPPSENSNGESSAP